MLRPGPHRTAQERHGDFRVRKKTSKKLRFFGHDFKKPGVMENRRRQRLDLI